MEGHRRYVPCESYVPWRRGSHFENHTLAKGVESAHDEETVCTTSLLEVVRKTFELETNTPFSSTILFTISLQHKYRCGYAVSQCESRRDGSE